MEDLRRLGVDTIAGVGCSIAPTTQEGSYMPVFVPGRSMAESLASAFDCRCLQFSHQQGHVKAAEFGKNDLPENYLALHVSGGTTEILKVEKAGYRIETIGGTKDISAGQTIDRIGVALGLPFPAGPHLERLCEGVTDTPYVFSSKGMGAYFSLSGVESAAQRAIKAGADPKELALGIFKSVARHLVRSVRHCVEETGISTVLFSGGVCSNQIIRSVIYNKLKGCDIRFGEPRLCSDNAVGVALLTREAACSEN